jgi:hypothetical protein
MIMKNLFLFMNYFQRHFSLSLHRICLFGRRTRTVCLAMCASEQSRRRARDLCYYGFNILRAREQLMEAEKYEANSFLFLSARLAFRPVYGCTAIVWCVIY